MKENKELKADAKTFKDLPPIVAVDFDGTLVDDNFPDIGKVHEDMFRVIKTIKNMGVKIILWTSRNNCEKFGNNLDDAVKFCKEHGLEFDAINENIQEVQELTGEDTRKVYADLYIDDKSIPDTQAPLYWVSKLGFNYTEFMESYGEV